MPIQDQLGIIQNLQMSPIPQISFLVGTFFVNYYKKTALLIWFQTHSISAHLKKDFRPTTINFLETFVQGNQMSWDQLCLGLNESQPSP